MEKKKFSDGGPVDGYGYGFGNGDCHEQPGITRLDALADAIFVQVSSYLHGLDNRRITPERSQRAYELAAMHIAEGDKFRARYQSEENDES